MIINMHCPHRAMKAMRNIMVTYEKLICTDKRRPLGLHPQFQKDIYIYSTYLHFGLAMVFVF